MAREASNPYNCNEAEIDRAIECLVGGMTLIETAREIGRSAASIRNHLGARGITYVAPTRQPICPNCGSVRVYRKSIQHYDCRLCKFNAQYGSEFGEAAMLIADIRSEIKKRDYE